MSRIPLPDSFLGALLGGAFAGAMAALASMALGGSLNADAVAYVGTGIAFGAAFYVARARHRRHRE